MSNLLSDDHALFHLLSRVASLYYLEEKTQSEVAKELNLSRQKVQRLLKQARELGIVEIHVHTLPVLHVEQEARIKALFNLDDVIIAPAHPDENRCRASVARAAAAYLERQLAPDSVVAVGLGRNASEVANFFRPSQNIGCTFVSAMGGSPYLGESINPNEICGIFAANSGGVARPIYAPAYVESKRVRNVVLNQDAVRQSLQMAKTADLAVIGIGTTNDDSILIQAGCLSLAEAHRLREFNVVGELLGNFFNEDGLEVDSDIRERLIALSLKDLRQIDKVIAVASEKDKSRAILAALRSGVIRVLVADCDNAVAILRLAGANDLKEDKVLLGSKDGN